MARRNRNFSRLASNLNENGRLKTVAFDESLSIGGSVTVYALAADLPLSNNSTGDQALVTETNRLYVWNGSGWYSIAIVNEGPTITAGGAGTYELDQEGTPTVITLNATDPEGFDLTWSYAVTSGSLEDTTVTQADNVFTVTPGTVDATFSLTFTVSDGNNVVTDVNAFTLTIITAPELLYGIAGTNNEFQTYSGTSRTTTGAQSYSDSNKYQRGYHLIGRTANSHFQVSNLPPLDFSGASLNRLVLAIKFQAVSHFENGFAITDNNGYKIGLVGYTNTNSSPARFNQLVSVYGTNDGKFHDSYSLESKGDLLITPLTTNPGAAGAAWRVKVPGASKTPFDVHVTDAGFSFIYNPTCNLTNSVSIFSRDATSSTFTGTMSNLTRASDSFESILHGFGVYPNTHDVDDCLLALESEIYQASWIAAN